MFILSSLFTSISLKFFIKFFIEMKSIIPNNMVIINNIINVFLNFFFIALIIPNIIVSTSSIILIKLTTTVNIPDTPNVINPS